MSGRAALIVLDAPELDLVERLLTEGRMPNLARILTSGRSVLLGGAQGLLTGASWTTLTLGATPDQSGILGADRVLPGTYAFGITDISASRQPPLWRLVSDAGLRSTVVSVYGAAPLEGLLGTQVSGWGSHDAYARDRWASEPPGLVRELERRFGPRRLRYETLRPRGESQLREYVAGVLEGLDQQADALCWLARETEWDLFAGAMADAHQAGHYLWHLDRPEHPEHDPTLAADVRGGLADIHERADAALGRVAEALPADATLYVTSPYTHCANHHLAEVVPGLLEDAGLLTMARGGPQGVRPRAIAAGRSLARTVLPLRVRFALGRRVGRDRIVAEQALAGVDWATTRAYAVPSDTSSAIRVNLAGREPDGCVSAADYERVRDEIIELLLEARDADSGEPVAARVERFEDVYGGEPWESLPDLCVEWRTVPGVRAVRSRSGSEIAVPRADERVSAHRPPGFLAARGAGIDGSGRAALGPAEAKLVDVAPTVLARLGVDLPPYMRGAPIPALTDESQRQARV